MFSKNARFSWGRALAVYSYIIFLTACSDDDAPETRPDAEQPTVSVTGLSNDARVWNTITLTIEAGDNESVKQVEIQVDNATVLTSMDQSFTYELDTKDLADGRHTLTLLVTDGADNTKTQPYTFFVQNTLVSIDVPEDFPGAGKKGFVLLSDDAGQVLASRTYQNGDTLRIRNAAFNGGEFYLTEVYIDEGDNYQELRTYTHIQRGDTWAPRRGDIQFGVTPPPAGTAYLNFTNALPDVTYVVTSDVEATFVQSDLPTASLDLQREDGKLYITRSENDPDEYMTHYLLTAPVAIGENAGNDAIDLGQVSNALTIGNKDLSMHGFHEGNLHITGHVTAGDYLNKYGVSDSYVEDDHIRYRYPGEAFAAYYSRADLYGDGYSIHNYVNGLPDVEPLDCAIDVHLHNNTFTGTITGDDIDFTEFRIGYDNHTEWYIFSPGGTIDFTLPDLPDDILAFVSLESTGRVSSAAAIHSFDFDGYDAFLEYIQSSDYGSHFAENFGAAYKRYDVALNPDATGRLRQRKYIQPEDTKRK
ncbi:Ig-like domain-containing protein [Dawidia soli]|uniref:Uncharacterized protein n=1 Tax=Dawidia soli TaxID=2782352 RepID=A0AAP2GGK0_9BACT|nr:Ig-like domain-containing protein [Dawidia soli]MBT1685088.1 hypothetical protein [Dawidia soli]